MIIGRVISRGIRRSEIRTLCHKNADKTGYFVLVKSFHRDREDAFVEIDLQSHEKHAWRKLLWPFSQNLIFLPYNTHRTHKQVFLLLTKIFSMAAVFTVWKNQVICGLRPSIIIIVEVSNCLLTMFELHP